MGARRKTVISKSWLYERKEILRKIKDQVRLYLGAENEDLVRYGKAYKSDLLRPWAVSQWSEVFSALEQVQVVFGGDFHPFAQAQRSHLRILRKVVRDRPVVLGLECLFVEDQAFVDQFLQGTLSEEDFLKAIQWDQRWGFPWAHYRPLFEFAKKENMSILALNVSVDERTGQSLGYRDERAAQKILQEGLRDENGLCYVLYGDLHIASQHLPEEFRSLCVGQGVETLTLFLNSENIYFQLAEEGREHQVEVVRFNSREFCLLTSPPWVKWQSYLMYLEENFDVDLEWDDEDEMGWETHLDHTDHVSHLVKMISSSLDLTLKVDAVEVYSLEDPQAFVVTEKVLNKEDSRLAHDLIQSNLSFSVPHKGVFYLSKATVNHAATLAGMFVHAHLCGRQQMAWGFPGDFTKSIWIEAMSFLLSKFVNPKRKAQTMADLKKQLEAFEKEDQGREPLLLALDHKMLELLNLYGEKTKNTLYSPRRKSSYVHAAKFIGELLGNRYFKLYEKQILGIDKVRELLSKKLSATDFKSFYFDELKNLDRLEMEA